MNSTGCSHWFGKGLRSGAVVAAFVAGFVTVWFFHPMVPRRELFCFVVEEQWLGAELLVEGARRVRIERPETQVFIERGCYLVAVRQDGCRAMLLDVRQRAERDGTIHLTNRELEELCR